MARSNHGFTRILVASLLCGNATVGFALARSAEPAPSFGCQNPNDECACIVSTKVCSHIPPLSEFSCHFQDDCNET